MSVYRELQKHGCISMYVLKSETLAISLIYLERQCLGDNHAVNLSYNMIILPQTHTHTARKRKELSISQNKYCATFINKYL